MVVWQPLSQRLHQFILFFPVWLERWGEPIGHQDLESTIFPPRFKPSRILQDLEHKRFVVALEKDALMAPAAFDQQIDGLSRRRSTINIISQKDMERPGGSGVGQMIIDGCEHIPQLVCASVDVADRIDTNSFGQPRFGHLTQM